MPERLEAIAGAAASSPGRFREFFLDLTAGLEAAGILWLVERNYQDLPDRPGRDLDILVEAERAADFARVARRCARSRYRLLLETRAYGGGRLYLHDPSVPSAAGILRLDYMTVPHFRGLRLLEPRAILGGRRGMGGFWVPSPGGEAALSLVIPLVYSGRVRERYREAIEGGLRDDREGFVGAFGELLPPETVGEIASHVLEGRMDDLGRRRGRLLAGYVRRRPLGTWAGFARYLWGYAHRLGRPPGLTVCLLGPDGTGKSSVVERLGVKLSALYPEGRYLKLHWRPGLLPQLSRMAGLPPGDPSVPHPGSRRGKASSFLRWLYYTADYPLGYAARIWPRLLQGAAAVFDRYYQDVVVDPARYGFNLPAGMLRAGFPLVPSPDLTVFLDGRPEELLARKSELPARELERQLATWRELLPSLPNAVIIGPGRNLEEAAEETALRVLERRADKTAAAAPPPEADYLWPASAAGGYAALPSARRCRWLVPRSPRLSVPSWGLYRPYSLRGRLASRLLGMVSALGLLRALPRAEAGSAAGEALARTVAQVLGREDLTPAMSAGTPGPHRKATVLLLTPEGRVAACLKIACSEGGCLRLEREAWALGRLRDLGGALKSVSVPECLFAGEVGGAGVLIQTAAPPGARKMGWRFDDRWAAVLDETDRLARGELQLRGSAFLEETEGAPSAAPASFRPLLETALGRLVEGAGRHGRGASMAHGDFAPWNALRGADGVFLFDWEAALDAAPRGLDLAHFLFQTGYLLLGLRGARLLAFMTGDSLEWYKIVLKDRGAGRGEARWLALACLLRQAAVEDGAAPMTPQAAERRRLMALLTDSGGAV